MSRSARLRSKLEADMGGPEAKRRRLGNNGLSIGNGISVRSGTGPRTRGMTEINDATTPTTPTSNVQSEKLFSGVATRKNAETPRDGDHETSSPSGATSSESESSGSEDSSDMDVHECEKNRSMYHEDLSELERQFLYLKEFLFKERLLHAEETLAGIRAGTAKEYLNPLELLQRNMAVRIKYAGNLRDFQLQSLQHKIDGEAIAARQNLESEKALLIGEIRSGLEERIHRLEEDRNNDFTSELWLDNVLKRKNKKSIDIFGEKKKKPITVSGPFIVYMLNDVDIVEDWTVMKKAVSAPKRKFLTCDSLLVV